MTKQAVKTALLDIQAQIQERLDVNGATDVRESLAYDIACTIFQYQGSDDFERLSIASQFLTAVAWENQPSNSYFQCIGELGKIDSRLTDAGPTYTALAKGDYFCASLTQNPHPLDIDLEEWWRDIPEEQRKHLPIDTQTVYDIIVRFSEGICEEIRHNLKLDYGLTVEQAVTFLAIPAIEV